RTLRALIEWSGHMLSDEEAVLLRRLSIFSAGWGMEAAEKVCAGDLIEEPRALDLLARLVEKSLVEADPQGSRDGGTRYRMLGTVRDYARGRLAETAEEGVLARRLLAYLTAFAEEAEAGLSGPQQDAWLWRLDQAYPDMIAVLERCARA